MDLELLKKARQEVIDRHKILESVPGSGWCPQEQARPESFRHWKPGEDLLSNRPVVIQDDDRIYLVGPDVDVIKAALVDFGERAAPVATRHSPEKKRPDLIGLGQRYLENVLKMAARALDQSDGVIALSTQEWNYCNEAVKAQGVLCVHTAI